jgi:hypothetical protein
MDAVRLRMGPRFPTVLYSTSMIIGSVFVDRLRTHTPLTDRIPWEELRLHPFKSFPKSEWEQVIQEGIDRFQKYAKLEPNPSNVTLLPCTSLNVCRFGYSCHRQRGVDTSRGRSTRAR